MVIIKIMGGMGNQLFQYALGLELKHRGVEVKIDTSYYKEFTEGNTPREYMGDFFVVPFLEASEDEIDYFRNKKRNVLDRITNKQWIYIDNDEFDARVLKINEGYLMGYWQSEQYFSNVKNEVIELVRKNYHGNTQLNNIDNPVSVHFRGGDYYNKFNIDSFGNICNQDYYKKAIDLVKTKIPQCNFIVFTNDEDMAKRYLPDEKYIFINNDENQGYIDMCLMSECRANILANSSFSWWGTYINCNDDKLVIAPSIWNKKKNNREMYCKDWILV